MKLIVGLGNPGSEYDKTRHNVGFVVIDRLLSKYSTPGLVPKGRFSGLTWELSISTSAGPQRCVLLMPTTYMNLSGRSVGEALNFFKLSPQTDLLVIVDDTALPCGSIRLRPSGGAGGHNGLRDIQRALASQDYPRLRIGIDSCPPFMSLEDYVLSRFTPDQQTMLAPALDKAVSTIECWISEGLTPAMNKFNAPEPSRPEGEKKQD